MRFSIDFFSLLARFSTPTCLPKPTKIHQKSMLRGNPSWASIFYGFWIDFWCQLQPHNLEKSFKNQMFCNSFCKIGLSKLASISDPNLVPTCLHFPSKNPTKLHQNWNLEGIELLIDFCIDLFIEFPSIWDANLDLSWPLRRAQDASKTAPKMKCATFFAPPWFS